MFQILKDKAYETDKNRKYDGYQRSLASMVYKLLDRKTGSGVSVNEKLAEELHKSVIKKFKRREGVIDVFTKYACVKLLKDREGKTVLNAFIEIVNES